MTEPTSDRPQTPTLDYGTPARRRYRWWLLAAIFAGVVALGLLAFAARPKLITCRPTANRAKCAANLQQIGLAILLYQQDHGGAYPASFAEMATEEQIGAETFVCPSSDDEMSAGATTQAVAADLDAGVGGHHCSYVYLGCGLTDRTVKDTTVVCYEPPENHDGDGGNVLFGDGHAEWEPKGWLAAKLPAAVATTRPYR